MPAQETRRRAMIYRGGFGIYTTSIVSLKLLHLHLARRAVFWCSDGDLRGGVAKAPEGMLAASYD